MLVPVRASGPVPRKVRVVRESPGKFSFQSKAIIPKIKKHTRHTRFWRSGRAAQASERAPPQTDRFRHRPSQLNLLRGLVLEYRSLNLGER